MELSTVEKGRAAEDIALELLLSKGLVLRERNWRSGHREIDLIMESDNKFHIIEVRSLNAPSLILPQESVQYKKQQLLIKAASSYIFMNNVKKEVSFDIVSIVFYDRDFDIEYIPDAFIPFCK